MRRIRVLVLVPAFLAALALAACGADGDGDEPRDQGGGLDVDFVVDVRPASLFVDMGDRDFDANGVRPSTIYLMPNFGVGIGLELENAYLSITGDGGMLVNDEFRSFFIGPSAYLNFEVNRSCDIGPRLGLYYTLDPEWIDDTDAVDFDEEWGWLLGLQMSIGDRVSYIFSVDFVNFAFDAKGNPGVTLDQDELELIGLAFQFGVRGEF